MLKKLFAWFNKKTPPQPTLFTTYVLGFPENRLEVVSTFDKGYRIRRCKDDAWLVVNDNDIESFMPEKQMQEERMEIKYHRRYYRVTHFGDKDRAIDKAIRLEMEADKATQLDLDRKAFKPEVVWR